MRRRIGAERVTQAKATTDVPRTSIVRRMLRVIFTPAVVPHSERLFEKTIIVPLLEQWKLPFRQQVHCRLRLGKGIRTGRIDFLVHTEDNAAPLTLFENKRSIRNIFERDRAVVQANAYARARRLRSFVIAAPEGLWVYSRPNGKPHLEREFTADQLRAGALEAKMLLIALSQRVR